MDIRIRTISYTYLQEGSWIKVCTIRREQAMTTSRPGAFVATGQGPFSAATQIGTPASLRRFTGCLR